MRTQERCGACGGIGGDPIEVSVPAASPRRRPGYVDSPQSRPRNHAPSRHPRYPSGFHACRSRHTIDAGDELEAGDQRSRQAGCHRPRCASFGTRQYERRPRVGCGCTSETLDRRTFTLTDFELEHIAYPSPAGWAFLFRGPHRSSTDTKVDFYWPDLGLVVETDGLRYHRTPGPAGRRIGRRDQAHTAAGLTPLRFTRAQVALRARARGETLGHAVGTSAPPPLPGVQPRARSWQTPLSMTDPEERDGQGHAPVLSDEPLANSGCRCRRRGRGARRAFGRTRPDGQRSRRRPHLYRSRTSTSSSTTSTPLATGSGSLTTCATCCARRIARPSCRFPCASRTGKIHVFKGYRVQHDDARGP